MDFPELDFMFEKDQFMDGVEMDAGLFEGGDLFDGYTEELDSPLSGVTDDDGMAAAEAAATSETLDLKNDVDMLGWSLAAEDPLALSASVVPAPLEPSISYTPMKTKDDEVMRHKKKRKTQDTSLYVHESEPTKRFCTAASHNHAQCGGGSVVKKASVPKTVPTSKPVYHAPVQRQRQQAVPVKQHEEHQLPQQRTIPRPATTSIHAMQMQQQQHTKARPSPVRTAVARPTATPKQTQQQQQQPNVPSVPTAMPAVTPKTNSANAEKGRQTSTFRGVSCCGKDRKWQARIRDANRVRYLGRFATELEAALTYDKAAREVKGEAAATNFVDMSDATIRTLKDAFAKHGCVPITLQHLVHCPRKQASSSSASSSAAPVAKRSTALVNAANANDFPDSPLAKVMVKPPAMAPPKSKATAYRRHNGQVQNNFRLDASAVQHMKHPTAAQTYYVPSSNY